MGWGRTGMVLAMYLMAFYNKSAKLAITEVRNLRQVYDKKLNIIFSVIIFLSYYLCKNVFKNACFLKDQNVAKKKILDAAAEKKW